MRSTKHTFLVGQQVIVTSPSQADHRQGIRGDTLGNVQAVTESFIHVRLNTTRGETVYPFFHHQIRPF